MVTHPENALGEPGDPKSWVWQLWEKDRAWKPVTALQASNPKKADQGWDMGLSEDKAEVDLA